MEPIVAVEVGTSKVRVLVGEVRDDGSVTVIGVGEQPSAGVQKATIVDFEKAKSAVRNAINSAEQNSNVEIGKVHLVLNGASVTSMVNSGTVHVFDGASGITKKDINEVIKVAKMVNLPGGREILHTIHQKYTVDGQSGILNPEGMHGMSLSLDVLIVHGKYSVMTNIARVVRETGLEIVDSAFSALCSALAVLTGEQKQGGVLLIDMGAGTTDYITYADGVLADVSSIDIGGDHITNDITIAFNISSSRAELLKKENITLIPDATLQFQQISIPEEMGFPACSIAAPSLNLIVNARLEELFTIIKNDLQRKGLLPYIGGGIVLTGGCANIKNIKTLAEQVFDLPCSIGIPRYFSGLSAAIGGGTEYTATLGMIRYALMTSVTRQEEKKSLSGLIKRWFSN